MTAGVEDILRPLPRSHPLSPTLLSHIRALGVPLTSTIRIGRSWCRSFRDSVHADCTLRLQVLPTPVLASQDTAWLELPRPPPPPPPPPPAGRQDQHVARAAGAGEAEQSTPPVAIVMTWPDRHASHRIGFPLRQHEPNISGSIEPLIDVSPSPTTVAAPIGISVGCEACVALGACVSDVDRCFHVSVFSSDLRTRRDGRSAAAEMRCAVILGCGLAPPPPSQFSALQADDATSACDSLTRCVDGDVDSLAISHPPQPARPAAYSRAWGQA